MARWRVPVVVVRVGPGTLTALVLLLAALVYQGTVPAADLRVAYEGLKAAFKSAYTAFSWLAYLTAAVFIIGAAAYHESLWFWIVRQKDREIERLVQQRNELERVVMKRRGTTGQPGPRGKEGQGR